MKIKNYNIFSAFLHGSGLLLKLAFMLFLIKNAEPEILGYYTLAVALESICIYFSGFEFHTFTSRRYLKNPTIRRLRLLIFVHKKIVYISSLMAVAGTIIFNKIFSLTDYGWHLFLMSLIVVFGVVIQEIGRYLVITDKSFYSVLLGFIRTAAWQPVAIILTGTDSFAFGTILLLWCIASFFSLIIGLFLIKNFLVFDSRVRYNFILHGINASKSYYLISLMTILQGNAEKFILQLILGPSIVGVFSFYQTVANTLSAVMQASVLNSVMPKIIYYFGRRDLLRFDYLKNSIYSIAKYGVLLVVFISGAVFPVVHLMKKDFYVDKMWILPILLFSQYIVVCTQPIHLAFYAKGYDSMLFKFMTFNLLAALLFNYLFVYFYGFAGSVISPLIVSVLIFVFRVKVFSLFKRREMM